MNKAKLQTLGLSFHPDLETWPLHSGERAFLGSEHTHAFVDFFFLLQITFFLQSYASQHLDRVLVCRHQRLSFNGAVCVGAFYARQIKSKKKTLCIYLSTYFKRNSPKHIVAIF